MSAERVIEIAQGELGYTENPPGSNRTKYGAAYGLQGQPWCVCFLWWCFREAGESSAFFGGGKTASCGTLLRWYQEQGQTVPVSEVQPGDVVILNFHGTNATEHCGYVTGVDSIYISTIEGNTSIAGSQSNGGIVCEKTRYPYQIVGVCRPAYKEEEEPVKDYEKHWAEKAIRWELDKGISNGYPDGSYKPDQEITRAEDATKLYRYNEMIQIELAELRKEIARLKNKEG